MDPEYYNKLNSVQIKEGTDLIEKLSSHKQLIKFKYILDIGCGPGNLTVLINNINQKIERIYGIDIDKNMIEYAKHNNCGDKNNIEYLNQDFSVDWNQFRPELRALEGKVSIIFTNYALHWIYNQRDKAAENIFRLLSKKGKVFAKINYIPDIKDKFQSNLLNSICNLFAYIPKIEEQEKQWTESFLSNGLNIIEFQCIKSQHNFETNEFDQLYPSIGFGCYGQFYGKYLINTLRLISRLIGVKPSAYLPQFKDETTGQTMCSVEYQTFLFVLNKC